VRYIYIYIYRLSLLM